MKLSMIIPLYHGQKYVAQLLAMAQQNQIALGSAHELELIFVNDSPQEPLDKTCALNAQVPVRFLENKINVGIHGTRVYGIAAAEGEYLLLLDQDDSIAPDFFVSQLCHLRHDADVVVANGVTEYPGYDKSLYRWGLMQWTVKHMLFYALFDCRILSPGHCLLRKQAIPQEWLENPLKENGADDMLLWLIMLSSGAKFTINRQSIYRHCYTAGNVSLDKKKMMNSVEELLVVARKTKTVRKSILWLLNDRIKFQKGERKSLVWKIFSSVQASGEQINRI